MVCKDCHSFKTFGQKCWFFWEEKKTCTQHRKSQESEPEFKTIEEFEKPSKYQISLREV